MRYTTLQAALISRSVRKRHKAIFIYEDFHHGRLSKMIHRLKLSLTLAWQLVSLDQSFDFPFALVSLLLLYFDLLVDLVAVTDQLV